MQINFMTLTNFGPYQGSVRLDLRPEDERNIILIGGQNGSGKTTLLEAFKLALYGPLAFGLKNVNSQYLNYIEDRLNRHAIRIGDNEFGLDIDFELQNSGRVDILRISRRWFRSSGRIKESFEVIRNGEEMSSRESFDFMHYFLHNCPPSLLDFFFFDGERLNDYFRGTRFEEELRDSALNLFNLDVFSTLSKDITTYIKQKNTYSQLPEAGQSFHEAEEAFNRRLQELNITEESIQQLRIDVEDRRLAISELEKEFRIHGGLLAEERAGLKTELARLEDRKNTLHEWCRNTIAELLPFSMVSNLLSMITEQLQLEENDNIRQLITKQIDVNSLEKILSGHPAFQESDLEPASIESLAQDIREAILPAPLDTSYQPMHLLAAEDKDQINKICVDVRAFKGESLNQSFSEIGHIIAEMQDKRKSLETNANDENLDALLKNIKELQAKNEQSISQLVKLTTHLDPLKLSVADSESSLAAARSKMQAAQKDENVYGISYRVKGIADRFVDLQLTQKTHQMGLLFGQMMSLLMRKDGFITGMSIEPHFEAMELIGQDGIIPRHHLSSGEKQLYILSLIWALMQASHKQLPLVFDTLIGRLDSQHKSAVLEKFLPRSSGQTIVLATDTEIDNFDYARLKPYIAREYVMEYLISERRVQIHPDCFFSTFVQGGPNYVSLSS